jgi:glutaminyl-peptide cyclotransferase
MRPIPLRVLFLLFAVCPRSAPGGQALRSVPTILKTIPHDQTAFTQGLLYYGGKLYESTGIIGQSTLRCVDPLDGKVEKKIAIPDLFAEGLARRGQELVQLSWQEKTALVYSLPDLSQKGYFRYDGEGWGLTSDSASFIMSNGSDTLYVRSPAFVVTKKIPVRLNGQPVAYLNELEYVNGIVYANIWFNTDIVAIRLKTGAVERVIDCRSLVREAGVQNRENVLNGIAYNPSTRTFFLTGKNWPVMFEVIW